MIRVEHEDVEELKKWGMGLQHILEACRFCGKGTRYWHQPTNNPVCQSCAAGHTVAELKALAQASDGVAPIDGGQPK
jgi:hypothetical protein